MYKGVAKINKKHILIIAVSVLFSLILAGSSFASTKYINTDGSNQSLGNNDLMFLDNTNSLIGIGTITPKEKLVINAADDEAIIIINSGLSSSNISAIDFYDKESNKWGIGKDSGNDFYIDEYGTGNRLTIKQGGNVSINGSTFFVDALNERVGIGTKSPGRELEVAGTINATGLNITGTSENATFMGDVQIMGTLYGGSPLKISGGINITGGSWIFPDGTTQSTASASASVQAYIS